MGGKGSASRGVAGGGPVMGSTTIPAEVVPHCALLCDSRATPSFPPHFASPLTPAPTDAEAGPMDDVVGWKREYWEAVERPKSLEAFSGWWSNPRRFGGRSPLPARRLFVYKESRSPQHSAPSSKSAEYSIHSTTSPSQYTPRAHSSLVRSIALPLPARRRRRARRSSHAHRPSSNRRVRMLILLDCLVGLAEQTERDGALAQCRHRHLLLRLGKEAVAHLANDGLDFQLGALEEGVQALAR